jgi:hypothetical protein
MAQYCVTRNRGLRHGGTVMRLQPGRALLIRTRLFCVAVLRGCSERRKVPDDASRDKL